MSEEKAQTKSQRDIIREQVFSSKNRKRKVVNFFGQEVELRQPSIGEVMDLRSEESTKKMVARMLVNYCFVPGTNDKVFDEADTDSILNLPFGEEFMAMQNAVNELTGINVEEQEKNLGSPLGE